MKRDVLKELVNLDGISGSEKDVRDFILKEIRPYLKDIKIDKMGNVIARKPGRRPTILLLAHMDEVGLMVRSIDEKGKIYISEIGGIDPAVLVGMRVDIKFDGKKRLTGVITHNDILNSADLEKKVKMEELFIYTGLEKKELVKMGVKIGMYVSFNQSCHYFEVGGSEKMIAGKALDDRIGCYTLIELIKNYKGKNEVYFVFTVQEEIGLYGARASIFNLDPDYALAIDVTGHDDETGSILLGKGPVITVKDSEMLGNICLNENLEKSAKKLKIPLQLEVSDFGTTDAASVFAAKGGIPSGVVGVSVGNMHTTISIASRNDVDNLIKILTEFLKNPPKECWR